MNKFLIKIFFCLYSLTIYSANLKLLPHQKIPLKYLKKGLSKGLLIDHALGTGKTITSLAITEEFKDKEVIICVPDFLVSNWQTQITKYGVKNKKRYNIISFKEASQKLLKVDISDKIIIIDEAHKIIGYLNHPNDKIRTSYNKLYNKIKKGDLRIILTGTPVVNSISDIAYIINLTSGKEILPYNKAIFRKEYTKINRERSAWRGFFTESKYSLTLVPLFAIFTVMSLSIDLPIIFATSIVSTAIIPTINSFFPLNKYNLRSFDPEKLKEISAKYVSFYSPEEDSQQDYPSTSIKYKRVPYNNYQMDYFLSFSDLKLSQDMLEKIMITYFPSYDEESLELNSSVIQERISNITGSGREIGNMSLNNMENNIDPPKFQEIYKEISKTNGQIAIYSNYKQNGINLIYNYLKDKGLEEQIVILDVKDTVENQTKKMDQYNKKLKRIILIDPELTEGISLMGTEQFHILEPATNSSILKQIIGRVVRYKSHSHLPKKKRHVDIFIWVSVVSSSIAITENDLAKQKNYLENFSEANSNSWTKGIESVDKNYYRKEKTPDEHALLHMNELEEDIDVLRDIFLHHSIERNSY